MATKFAYLLFTLCFPAFAFAESGSDSIFVQKNQLGADTAIIDKYNRTSRRLSERGDYDKADSLARLATSLSEKIGYGKGIIEAYDCMGTISDNRGNMDEAVDFFNKGLKIALKMHNKKAEALAYGDLGIAYLGKGEYAKSLEYHFKALQVREEMKNNEDIANSLGSISEVYFQENDFEKSLDYAQRSERLAESMKDTTDMVSAYNDIADVYDAMHKYPLALEIDLKVLTIYQRRGKKLGIALTENNIADVYYAQNNYPKSLEYYNKSLTLAEEMNNRHGMSLLYFNMGNIYADTKDFKKALEYENRSLELAKEINSPDDVRTAEQSLWKVYEAMGDNMKALQHFKNFIAVRDSLYSQENTKKNVQTEMNYEFAKKQAAEKADQDKKDALQKVQARKQRLTLYFISGILALVLVFAGFAYRSYLQKQRANQELDEKNSKIESAYSTIEQKNKEITDSINYAKRIQQAMLPDINGLTKTFPESFILFKPKDIVSGDFYWMGTPPLPAGEGKATIIAAADCTGHGVPGAFMSMIGSEKLQDAIQQTGNAGEALQLLNKGIRTSLRQSSEHDSTRDGMDIALASLSPSEGGSMTIEYAGANRPLWILRKGKSEMEEIKATKKAIGGFTEADAVFEVHRLTLNKGDTFYIFSDGYADQFGGKDGKKMTTRKFKELLLSLKDEVMSVQLKRLDSFIEEWKGDREQLDDVLVIGIRV